MISTKNVQYMLKEAKARAKQKEFQIQLCDYPNFMTDFRDLDYSSVFVLSKYAEAIINDNVEEKQEYYNDLRLVSQYFDSATNIIREFDYSIDYLLSGACAYFLSDDFGSAKALLVQLNQKNVSDIPRKLTISIMQAALGRRNRRKEFMFDDSDVYNIYNNFLQYLDTGEDKYIEDANWSKYRESLFLKKDIYGIYYTDILFAIIRQVRENSTWLLLPNLSKIEKSKWHIYLSNKNSMKILWSAQRIIGEAGILEGKSGIIQLPTGVGKTKSLELIIRSAFIGDRTNAVIVITPLRALCNEIKGDLQRAFGKELNVNQFSDVLQEDFDFSIADNEKVIIVCTPEKLKYILHRNKNFLDNIGLFIFDEGHMFDSPKRGAAYELLVTTIKSTVGFATETKQCVFISAVLSNSEQIGNWLYNGTGVIASSENIKTTEKNIGFVSTRQNNIDYYTNDDFYNKNYWVQNVFKKTSLVKNAKKISKNVFPEDESKDISLYLMNLLSPNGAVAIYISRPDWIRGYIKRIIEIESCGLNFDNLSHNTNDIEKEKLQFLFGLHYGENFIYAQGIKIGVAPHYADLEEGAKLSVEYAIRKEFIRNVICTSTLAQGVNIPIRYLLITAFDSYQRDMKARDLQNLVGRTARAGMHTEGSIIITDINLYAQRHQGGGRHNWGKKTALFNPQNSEPCESTVSMICKPQIIHRKYKLDFKNDILNAVIAKDIGIKKLRQEVIDSCKTSIADEHERSLIISDLEHYFNLVKKTLEAIESHLSFLFSIDSCENSTENIEEKLCKLTLAYELADEEEKSFLMNLFKAIAKNVSENTDNINHILQAKAMTGIQNTVIISKWISENIADLENKNVDDMIERILPLYHNISENKEKYSNEAIFAILKFWINGEPLCSIYNNVSSLLPPKQDIIRLEKFCRKSIAYSFSFLVGNIIDLCEQLTDSMKLQLQYLQKRLKYGLKTLTSISIYEEGLSDRIITQQIANLLENYSIDEKQIVEILRNNREQIENILQNYPSFFSEEFRRICR